MDIEAINALTALADKLSIIAVLLMELLMERRRADRLEAKLIMNADIEAAKEP